VVGGRSKVSELIGRHREHPAVMHDEVDVVCRADDYIGEGITETSVDMLSQISDTWTGF
jgi:hypothetical protein